MKNTEIKFDIIRAKAIFPGAFHLLGHTNQLLNNIAEAHDNTRALGILAYHSFILGHTIELLLKFRIQTEGGKIEGIHNLYELFNSLKDNSKICVEDMYKKLESSLKIEQRYRYSSIESLLKSCPYIHVDWRYVVEENKDLEVPLACLYLAAHCIYKKLVE